MHAIQNFSRRALSLLVLVVSVAAHAQTVTELPADQSTWQAKVPAGGTLRVFGGLGDIEVVKSDTEEVKLSVTRGSGKVAPRVVIVESAKGFVICGDWTTSPLVPSLCPKTKKMLVAGKLKDYVPLTFQLSVPQDVDVDLTAWTGNIKVGPLNSSVSAQTYEGDVHVSSTGRRVRAENQQGLVTVELVPELIEQSIDVSTLRGAVLVKLPESRLVNLQIHPRGAEVRSSYDLGSGGVQRGDVYEYKGTGTLQAHLGPSKAKTWTKMNIFARDDIFATIQIVRQ